MSKKRTVVRSLITSIPGLAAALRETDRRHFPQSISLGVKVRDLVPMYQIEAGVIVEEAQSAARVISEIAERLRRMGIAYSEWPVFDAPAFFDLSTRQTARLVRVFERPNSVYVVFFADLLLPSFHAAESYWVEHFVPAYHAAGPVRSAATERGRAALDPFDAVFNDEVKPELITRWTRLLAVARCTRELLSDDIGFITTNGSQEERLRWRRVWSKDPAPGLDAPLALTLDNIPSLTLSYEFPLPAHRQSGRMRRLRRNREHSRFRRASGYR